MHDGPKAAKGPFCVYCKKRDNGQLLLLHTYTIRYDNVMNQWLQPTMHVY